MNAPIYVQKCTVKLIDFSSYREYSARDNKDKYSLLQCLKADAICTQVGIANVPICTQGGIADVVIYTLVCIYLAEHGRIKQLGVPSQQYYLHPGCKYDDMIFP